MNPGDEAAAVDGSAESLLVHLSYAIRSAIPAVHLTFAQGFILGQLSMLILVMTVLRYLLFEAVVSPSTSETPADKGQDKGQAAMGKRASWPQRLGSALATPSSKLQHGPSAPFSFFRWRRPKYIPDHVQEELESIRSDVLRCTGYELSRQAPESCNWLTVFLAQLLAKFRSDAEKKNILVKVISEALNSDVKPALVDSIRITQFSLGSDFLRIMRARMAQSDEVPLGMRAELELELNDELALGFDTRMLLNWPRFATAALPVSMVVSLTHFSGTLTVDFDITGPEPMLNFSILPDYRLELDVQTLIGSKTKVQNFPRLTELIIYKLHTAFSNKLVSPNKARVRVKHPFVSNPGEPAPARSPLSNQAPNNIQSSYSGSTYYGQPVHHPSPPSYHAPPQYPPYYHQGRGDAIVPDDGGGGGGSGIIDGTYDPLYPSLSPSPVAAAAAAMPGAAGPDLIKMGNPSGIDHNHRSPPSIEVKDSVRRRLGRAVKAISDA
ncbi:ERMES complex subunit mmm1 [Spiromyces aspiralis]|uniref:ERMES complex subunit mmm1 n=1 Tax=Spiromyces aspiralis TaxID=68401 RepID=A0ACC1HVQ1_9FUNG|nr:ERMES complex subunit mmm1 [Spiromyces aspiralis]